MIIYVLITIFLIITSLLFFRYFTNFKKQIKIKMKHSKMDNTGTYRYICDYKNVTYVVNSKISWDKIYKDQNYYIEGYGIYSRSLC